MTPEEARAVLASATEMAHYHQWDDVDHLLRHVYDEHLLQGTDQGDAAYLLGLAYLNTHSMDAAHYMLTEASTTATHEHQAEARRHLEEITRLDTATDTSFDGVVQSEAAGVLAAADDAVQRADYDDANAFYTQVYNGHDDEATRARAALGIATVRAHQGNLPEALQYAEYVAGTSTPSASAAHTLVEWIHQQQGADAMTADGTTVNEYLATKEAANSAFFNGDFAHAHTLYLSILASSQVAAADLAKAAFNAAQSELFLGLDADAREHFQFAVAHGVGDIVQHAQSKLQLLDNHDRAEALVHELAPDD